jgi:hypothetical protein
MAHEKSLNQELEYYLPRCVIFGLFGAAFLGGSRSEIFLRGTIFGLAAGALFTLFKRRWPPINPGNWTKKWAQFILACILAAGIVDLLQLLMSRLGLE